MCDLVCSPKELRRKVLLVKTCGEQIQYFGRLSSFRVFQDEKSLLPKISRKRSYLSSRDFKKYAKISRVILRFPKKFCNKRS